MRFRAVLGVVVAVVAVVAVASPGIVLCGSAAGASQTQPTATSATSNTTIAIRPHPNGDARVRIETRYVLDDTNDSTAFRRLGSEFEAGRAGVSVSTFEWAANESSIATGRGMNVTNVTRNATVVGENANATDVGVLTLGFTWTAFARTEGDRIVVGDAFNGTRGTWLPVLTADQTLVIESPRGYGISRSPPARITNGTVRFDGPTTFTHGTPVVWFERRGDASTTQGSATPASGLLDSVPLSVVGVGVLVVVGAVVGAYALLGREGNEPTDGRAEASPPAETDERSASNGSSDETAEELLSDEERVERLLTANGGRMRQASIVDETGWSNAKVSQLLSAMDEAGRVDKLRIGRENLISLPDE